MQTARVTILMSPDKKAAFDALAASRGVSTGEFFRRAGDQMVDAVDRASEDDEAMALVMDELETMLPRWRAQLDSMEASIDTASAAIRQALAEVDKTK